MIRIGVEKAVQLHEMMAAHSGGSVGLRDRGLLESALASAFSGFGGRDFYPTVRSKAAALGTHLIGNHAFVDGNKRIGILVMLTFLEVNGIRVQCTDAELIRVGLGAAAGELDYNDLLQWIEKVT